MPEFIDAYALLGVAPGARQDDIRAAYRRLAARHHPDLAPPEQRPAATARMQQINIAYGLVGTAALRARYDRLRTVHQMRGAFGDQEAWAQLLQAAGRWVGRQRRRQGDGWYRAGLAVGRWLRG